MTGKFDEMYGVEAPEEISPKQKQVMKSRVKTSVLSYVNKIRSAVYEAQLEMDKEVEKLRVHPEAYSFSRWTELERVIKQRKEEYESVRNQFKTIFGEDFGPELEIED